MLCERCSETSWAAAPVLFCHTGCAWCRLWGSHRHIWLYPAFLSATAWNCCLLSPVVCPISCCHPNKSDWRIKVNRSSVSVSSLEASLPANTWGVKPSFYLAPWSSAVLGVAEMPFNLHVHGLDSEVKKKILDRWISKNVSCSAVTICNEDYQDI